MHEYESGLQWMQQGKFEKARIVFEKLVNSGPPELLERARVYLVACERNVRDSRLTFANPGEQYDYAVSLLNTGDTMRRPATSSKTSSAKMTRPTTRTTDSRSCKA